MPETPPPALHVSHLSVQFDDEPVFRDLSFDVPHGASLAVIGPNGAGKTVLFRALLGAISYTGQVRWAPGVRIGYVPQKLDIERDVPITGRDFLTARAAVDRHASADLDTMLRLVGLSADTSRKRIGDLSGGQFQRLLVAFALLGNPTVLLLDEPTAGIDQPGEERLNAMLHRLQHERGLTILLISHELTVVHAYATHVLCLGSGEAFFGPPSVLTPEVLADLYREPISVHAHAH